MYSPILVIHIIAGFLALGSSFVAVYTKLVTDRHQLHLYSGRLFCWAMTIVFVTSIALTLLKPNLFLFVIAIFSYYLTFHGWRLALNRKGEAKFWDKTAAWVMIATSIVMIGTGGWFQLQGNGFGPVLVLFGLIGGLTAGQNLREFAAGPVKGKDRISGHLGAMLGATIAAITAFVVTNIQSDPAWIAWIAPTIIITPLIVYSKRKIEGKTGRKSKKQTKD
ncbi:hypothetical protein CYPRO_1227 [Cyclonatronum proteinivorum]|uniref:DUF2306 domain-containing protein n=1 Tax=Cyclonatronum proteinivorum TaxID=1457365 RepID=A0A345UJ38_9BACT|nr:hypothetical protein [Cyclonatronum proteinivorum]AXJ00490.1 hypothetical protein CYPRO_1227 [Cyclonatronum proteinivorum]